MKVEVIAKSVPRHGVSKSGAPYTIHEQKAVFLIGRFTVPFVLSFFGETPEYPLGVYEIDWMNSVTVNNFGSPDLSPVLDRSTLFLVK